MNARMTEYHACGRDWDAYRPSEHRMVSLHELAEDEVRIIDRMVSDVSARADQLNGRVSERSYPGGWRDLYVDGFRALEGKEWEFEFPAGSVASWHDNYISITRGVYPDGRRSRGLLVSLFSNFRAIGYTDQPFTIDAIVELGASPDYCIQSFRPL